MLGPVFSLELLRASRRGRHHQLRSGYVLWLALETAVLALLGWAHNSPWLAAEPDPVWTAGLLAKALQVVVVQQFVLVLFVIPALTAGSITDEKTTGSLLHLFTAPLDSWEIIRGKWMAQVLQGTLLVLPAAPVLVLVGGLTGLAPAQLLLLLLHPLPLLGFLAAAGLLASAWGRSTPSAVLGLYLCMTVALAPVALLGLADPYGPFALLDAVLADDQPRAWWALLHSGIGWGVPAVGCLTLAAWRLRPAYQKQLAGDPPRSIPAWRTSRPAVGDSPLRWKERYVGGSGGLPLVKALPRWAGVLLTGSLSLLMGGFLVAIHLPPGTDLTEVVKRLVQLDLLWVVATLAANPPGWEEFLCWGLGVSLLAGLAVAVRCSGAVSGERERQTWDALLTTPLEARSILAGKLWGVLDSASPYLLTYACVVLPLSLLGGWLAVTWTVITFLGTWLVMYFMGATGLQCSVVADSSWRSLLNALLSSSRTVVIQYLTNGLPLGLVLGGVVDIVLQGLLHFVISRPAGWLASVQLSMCLILSFLLTALFLVGEAERLLQEACRHIDQRERVPEGPLTANFPLELPALPNPTLWAANRPASPGDGFSTRPPSRI